MRKGIALIGAIIIMIVIAMLSTLMISFSTEGSKRTSDIYLQEQAQLMAKSAAEFTILAISGHDRDTNDDGILDGCINYVNSTYPASSPIFDINVTIRYIGFGSGNGCESYIDSISTPESNGTVLLDVYVTSKDGVSTEPIRYHKRALQKL
jgi:hypothetical protein